MWKFQLKFSKIKKYTYWIYARSSNWIEHQTPTLVVAGSIPVEHTSKYFFLSFF